MQVTKRNRDDVYPNIAYTMRRSGATLQQIGEKIGRTKERVRQILLEKYRSAGHELISTEQLRRRLGLSRPRVMKLYHDNIIAPRREWETNGTYFLLWSPDAVKKARSYLTAGVLCKICNRPVPKGRRIYCSDECYCEGHKYKYKSAEAKKRHLDSIRRYRNKRKSLPATVI